ncbi:hypothetical protein G6F43_010356 [Rhizopus delemar]|nr:hypothetical protein G6F43_010356 [Rhizopus delemar]
MMLLIYYFMACLLTAVTESAISPNLSLLQRYKAQGYRILSSKNVQGYTVRIKRPDSCEDTIQYSGYIDKYDTDDHFFFYFTASRSNPQKDPLVLWLNGGPGCSSMMGLWMELGPCLVNEDGNGTKRNPYSWNNAANILFLDQPVNVGYSYGKSKVKNTQESAIDVYAFLQLFLDEYKEYASNPFHIAGESYGGHYLPALSSEIIKRNRGAAKKGLVKINYQSMLIGNGWTDPRIQYRGYATYGCTRLTEYQPLFNQSVCEGMKAAYPRCDMMMMSCYQLPTALTCTPAETYCESTQTKPFQATGLNPYDIRVKCETGSGLCYDRISVVQSFANRVDTKTNLGVDPQVTKYETCSDTVGIRFGKTGDGSFDFSNKVAETLDAGVRVLLYVGEMDWICNWIGNLEWTLNMRWKGKIGYIRAPVLPWYSTLTGKHAGDVRTFENLTFLKVFGAGHMVPFDQPENALDFFDKWLASIPIAN